MNHHRETATPAPPDLLGHRGRVVLLWATVCLAIQVSCLIVGGCGPERVGGSAVLSGHRDEVLSLAFAPDGRTLASVGNDQTTRLWDTGRRRERLNLKAPFNYMLGSVTFSADGQSVAVSSGSGMPISWDVTTGRERQQAWTSTSTDVEEFQGCYSARQWGVAAAYSPVGATLATSAADGPIMLWDTGSARERFTLNARQGMVACLAFSSDGTTLASGGWGMPTVVLWDTASGRERVTLRGHSRVITGVAFSPDGRTVASCGTDGTVRLWDAASGRERARFRGHSGSVFCVAFAPGGRSLASGGTEGELLRWDAATLRVTASLQAHKGRVRCLAFSPDGRTLASGGTDTTIRLWDIARTPSPDPGP